MGHGSSPHVPHPPTHLMGTAAPGASVRGWGTESKPQLPVPVLGRGTCLSNQIPPICGYGELQPAQDAVYAKHHV